MLLTVIGAGLAAGAGMGLVGAGLLSPAPTAAAGVAATPVSAPAAPPAAAPLPVQPLAIRFDAPAADLQREVAGIVTRRCPNGVDIAVSVLDVAGAQSLADVRGTASMTPASNMKLLTTVTALKVLGPDFQFKTRLLLRPAPANAVDARPVLVVQGDGDPAFLDPVVLAMHNTTPEQVMQAFVAAAQKAAPHGYSALVVDARIFDGVDRPEGWPKDQLHTWYGAPVSGLNFANNVVSLQSQPTAPGGGVNIQIYPMLVGLQVVNTARTVHGSDKQGLNIGLAGDRLTVAGTAAYPSVEPFRMAFESPDREFADYFAHKLTSAGVPVASVRMAGGLEPLSGGTDQVLTESATPLTDVLLRTNRDSYNLFGECLLKRLAAARTHQPGSFTEGAATVGQVMTEHLGADSLTGWRQVDGCGLSREDRVTARLLTSALTVAARDPKAWPVLSASLARPGQPGTLEQRFKDGPTRAQVLAKTGYINGTSALSGFLVTSGEHPRVVAFSILCNGALSHAAMKPIQEEIVRAVDGWMGK